MLLLLKHRMTTKSKCPCLIYQLSNPNDRSFNWASLSSSHEYNGLLYWVCHCVGHAPVRS